MQGNVTLDLNIPVKEDTASNFGASLSGVSLELAENQSGKNKAQTYQKATNTAKEGVVLDKDNVAARNREGSSITRDQTNSNNQVDVNLKYDQKDDGKQDQLRANPVDKTALENTVTASSAVGSKGQNGDISSLHTSCTSFKGSVEPNGGTEREMICKTNETPRKKLKQTNVSLEHKLRDSQNEIKRLEDEKEAFEHGAKEQHKTQYALIETLQGEIKELNASKKTLETEKKQLESSNLTLKEQVTKLTEDNDALRKHDQTSLRMKYDELQILLKETEDEKEILILR